MSNRTAYILIMCFFLWMFAFAFLLRVLQASEPPQPALHLPCKIIDVYDGDTLTADITLRVRVRMVDCWAPEIKEAGGKESRDHLRELALDKDGILYVPLGGAKTFGDLFSFNRVVGRVYVDGEDVSQLQVTAGHATKERK